MSSLPSGTVTFLFTDVEGSTRLLQQHPEAAKAALARHHALLDAAIAAFRGHVFQVVGDGVCAAFEQPDDAVAAALAAQRALFHEPWPGIGAVRVRMGLHAGSAEARDGDYVSSLTLARTQRVAAAGHGGQMLLSSAAAQGVRERLPAGTTLRDLGAHKLRGITEPETIHQLVAPDLPSEFPSLLVEAAAPAPLQELVRGQLVGRAGELRVLTQHWDLAQQARGQLVLVSGEPGVGKTRLAQDLIAYAQRSGATLLRGGCYEYEATTPYLPFVEAFREWTRRQSAAQLRAALGATAPEIAKFAPEIAVKLAPLAASETLPPGEERLRLFDHAARFLATLAADNGVLLFIDDLHWADQGTLSLLHYLLRHLRNDRVLVLAAYREVELDRTHPLAAALVEWNRERLATRVQLGRLSRDDTAALLATLFGMPSVSDEFAAALYRETEGNPFFLEEVIKSLIEQGQIYRDVAGWARQETHELTLPQSVKEAIGRRLDRLGTATVDVLRTAAAIGKRFRFRELSACAAMTEDTLLDALDEASAAQLIRVDQGGSKSAAAGDDGFAFTHDKIREVLNDEANPIRRRRLHQRIGEALEALHGSSPEHVPVPDEHAQDLAHHFMQAGDLARSLAYSRRAARNAQTLFAHDEALQFLAQAHESAEGLGRESLLSEIDEEAGDIEAQRGTTPAAVASYERALAASDDGQRRAALKGKIGSVYGAVGDPRAVPYLEQAMAELDPATQTNDLALATAVMGRIHHYRAEHRRALEYLNRAYELAKPGADPFVLSLIQSYLAGAHQHLLEFEVSDRWARTTVELGERCNLAFAKASGYEFLGENRNNRGYWRDGIAYAAKDREEALRMGALDRQGWSLFCLAQGLQGKGDPAAAREAAEAALAMAEKIGELRLALWAAPALVLALADLGEDDSARAAADRNWQGARDLGQLALSAWALHALGYAAAQRGDLDGACAWYRQYVELVRASESGVARLVVMPDCADTLSRGGHFDEALAAADEAIAVADFAVAPHRRAIARRAQARAYLARGDSAAAHLALDEAIDLLHSMDSRLEWGRTLCLRAEASGVRDDASRARDVFVAVGAERDRQRAEALLGQWT